MFRINLIRGFLYPLTSARRLVAACLMLPLSLAILVPPILFGLTVMGMVNMNLTQGIGFGLGLGCICLVVGAIPFTFLAGYTLRCRKRVIEGESTLPPWNGVGELLSDGGRMDTLAVFFATPTMAMFWFGVASVAAPLTYLGQERTWEALALAVLGSSAGLASFLGALCWWFMAMLISPMATLRLARGHSTIEALSLRGILGDIRKGWLDYLLCCVVTWGISIIFSAAQTAFWPLVIVAFPVQVYLQLVWSYLLGSYARAYL